ncbi:hypothetical protein CSC15_0015 [Escherichia coli]|nr:hypothetical protein CSC15_0015 [Escherichia coli]
MSWIVLIISVVCAIGIVRIIHSVKRLNVFFTGEYDTNKTSN